MQPHLWQFLALTFAGWVNRSQQDAIEYLKEENRVLREQLGARRLRFTDDQRRRLAAKAKAMCRKNLKGRNTVKRILAEHGIEPAPARDKRTPWSTFLKAHLGAIAATDFFTVEVLTARGLIRYFVLFVIDLKTRRVEIAGIVHQPYEDWMKQIARNLTDAMDGFLRTTRFLIHDRDPLFSASFRATLSPAGVETVKLPARSPNLNAHAERFVRSIKHECLNRIVPLGKNHLRTTVRAYVAHYHLERNHQGLDNSLVSQVPDSPGNEGSIQCRERLGGILRYYYREAA